ncbi:energy-coupling factor transport system permease protein [Thermosipho japonicus]|uniref:Energy-coupling factor transport system permease protein n=1 Tax=Thermosipho japonicus TaxID=90323 RepID=A0A841GPN2_9BACT|nr:energy-coupling factor transporter transmembrane component T [Thermosipho japonicus]MBB6063184.1 energy-coupling factor transport system permease protein [Thermosipho japonicus]
MKFAFGRYVPTDSVIHSLDPRSKIVSSFLFIATVLSVNSLYDYIWLFSLFMVIVKMSKISIKIYLRSVKNMWFLIAFATVIQYFVSGIETAAFIALRLIFVVLFASFLTYTTSPLLIARGLADLLKYFGVKKKYREDFSMIMTISFRFIPILFDEVDRIIKAQIARGAKFDQPGIRYKVQGIVAIIIPLLISAIRKAEEISIALQARKYGVFERSSYYVLKWKKIDTYFFTFSIFVFLFLFILKIIF